MTYRTADLADVSMLAALRAQEWGSVPYWQQRIHGYMIGEQNPRETLRPRVVIAAFESGRAVGLIAGHLTHRYGCDGELQWINVARKAQRSGIGSALLSRLAAWFAHQDAKRICVDVDVHNFAGRAFYERHGATSLKRGWLVWDDIGLIANEPADL